MESPAEHELAYLLDFDGAIYLFDEGYWVKIEVKRTTPTPQRPHGLSYSLTLHDPRGVRLLGFDNATACLGEAAATRPGPLRTITGIGRKRTRAGPMNSGLLCSWSRTSWMRWSASWENAASRR